MVYSFDESRIEANALANDPIARLSASNKRAMANFLKSENNDSGSNPVSGDGLGSGGDQPNSNRVTERRTDEWLNYKLRCHLDNMIDQVI